MEISLEAEPGEYDAMLYAGEVLGVYSLLHPEFGVVVPQPPFPGAPAVYKLPLGEPEWLAIANGWLTLKRVDGTIDRLFEYWILGRQQSSDQPRWSIARDVLHWMD